MAGSTAAALRTREDPVADRDRMEAVIFDLDGVIVNTAEFHYLAWKRIADEEGIPFDERINERLKGVSRMESLRIILERSPRAHSTAEIDAMAANKNDLYVGMLSRLSPESLLPGIPSLLIALRAAGVKTSIYSASRNTDRILDRLGNRAQFDAVVTGNDVRKGKPDPEGLLLAARLMGVAPGACVVVEDAAAGLQAAAAAGMKGVGIGRKADLHLADRTYGSTRHLTLERLRRLFRDSP
jgi:beta-phosphoglucomutase